MLILLNQYIFIEVMGNLHDNKPIKCISRPPTLFTNKAKQAFFKQSKTGLFHYIVLHCIGFYDVNLTISPLDRPIPEEFTRGFP